MYYTEETLEIMMTLMEKIKVENMWGREGLKDLWLRLK